MSWQYSSVLSFDTFSIPLRYNVQKCYKIPFVLPSTRSVLHACASSEGRQVIPNGLVKVIDKKTTQMNVNKNFL